MTLTRMFTLLAALAAALFLTSCSAPATEGGHDHGATGDSSAADFNAADVTFARDMIPHHEQAVELSAMVPDRSTNPELQTLAKAISAAQEPEITQMEGFLTAWGEGSDGDTHADHGTDHSTMAGMVDEETMTKLRGLSGEAFDTLWLESMIAHHEGAVEMAQTELTDGSNAEAKALAQTIIDTQNAEIAQMRTMLGQTP